MDDLVSVPVVDPHALLTMKQDMHLYKAEDWLAQRQALLTNPAIPEGLKKVQLLNEPLGEVGPTDVHPTQNKTIKSSEESPAVIPKRCPVDDLTPVPTRPTKKKAKQALDTPLSEFERPRSVAKGKQVARQVTKDLAKKWLDF